MGEKVFMQGQQLTFSSGAVSLDLAEKKLAKWWRKMSWHRKYKWAMFVSKVSYNTRLLLLCILVILWNFHDDVIQWKHFPRCWPFARGIFPTQRPVTQSFDVFFDLHLNIRLSKQSWNWWFRTQSRLLWRHCNGITVFLMDTSQRPATCPGSAILLRIVSLDSKRVKWCANIIKTYISQIDSWWFHAQLCNSLLMYR